MSKDCSNTVFIFYIWRVNWRWYFTGVIIALACYGISLGQAPTNANQEIIVQFNTVLDSSEIQLAIADIKAELRSIGVEQVQVSEIQDGKIKVAYFSNKDVSVIKKLFLEQGKLQLGTQAFNEKENLPQFPFSQNTSIYKVDVLKIQQDVSSDLGFQGTLIEIKSGNDLYFKPIFPLSTSEVAINIIPSIKSAGCKTYSSFSLIIDNASYKIPEVRAGPLS